jgi:hypothetical protein
MLKDEVIRLELVEDISRSSMYGILKKVNSNLGKSGCGALAR